MTYKRLEIPSETLELSQILGAVRKRNIRDVRRYITKFENGEWLMFRDEKGRSAFHLACQVGAVDIIRMMLDDYTNTETLLLMPDKFGMTGFLIAVTTGQVAVVEALLKRASTKLKEMLISEKSKAFHENAFEAAIRNNDPELLRLLLKEHPNLPELLNGCFREDEDPPLYYAASMSYVAVISAILDSILRADYISNEAVLGILNCTNKMRSTSLHIAAARGHLNVISVLLERFSDRNKTVMLNKTERWGVTPLHSAVFNNRLDATQALVRNCPLQNLYIMLNLSDNVDGFTPLHTAIKLGNSAMVTYILQVCDRNIKAGILNSVSNKGEKAVHLACKYGNADILKSVLENASPETKLPFLTSRDKRGFTPLLIGTEVGDLGIVKAIIEACPAGRYLILLNATDLSGNSVLHIAGSNGSLDICRYILELCKDDEKKQLLRMRNTSNKSPLHIAIANESKEIITLFMDGTSFERVIPHWIKDKSTLHFAAERGYTDLVDRILRDNCDEGGKVDLQHTRDKHGKTPLHYAAENGHVQVVKIILDSAKELPKLLSQQCRARKTALYYACNSEHLDVVRILLRHASSTSTLDRVINQAKHSPLVLAASKYNFSICREIVSYNSRLISYPLQNGFRCNSVQRFKDILSFLKTNKHAIDLHARSKQNLTVINVLIKGLPDLVEQCLDSCLSVIKVKRRGSLKTYLLVNFSYLETFTPSLDQKDEGYIPGSGRFATETGGFYDPRVYKYKSAPLQIMADSLKTNLLQHPIVAALILRKWRAYGKNFYRLQLGFCLLFFIFLICYEVSQNRPTECKEDTSCKFKKSPFCVTSGIFVFFISIIMLSFELFNCVIIINTTRKVRTQYCCHRNSCEVVISYFRSLSNVSDILLYSTAAIFSFNAFTTWNITYFEWRCGIISVVTAIVKVVLLLRPCKHIGIYILMFQRVLISFSRHIGILLVILLLSFTIIFDMIYSEANAWKRIISISTFFKIFTLGSSAVDNDSYQEGNAGLDYSIAAIVFIIAFCMSILTGLSIGDVKKIKENSAAELNVVMIKKIYYAEHLISYLPKRYHDVLRSTRQYQLLKLGDFEEDSLRKWKMRCRSLEGEYVGSRTHQASAASLDDDGGDAGDGGD